MGGDLARLVLDRSAFEEVGIGRSPELHRIDEEELAQLLRPEHPVLDDYVYATTSPIYVRVAGSTPRPTEDAAFFIAWIDRLAEAAKANQNWNTEAEKTAVLQTLDQARQVYFSLQK